MKENNKSTKHVYNNERTTIILDLLVALPPVTERIMTVSDVRRLLGGLNMLATTGMATSIVVEPSVASSPVRETGPKLN